MREHPRSVMFIWMLMMASLMELSSGKVVPESNCQEISATTVTIGLVYQDDTSEAIEHIMANYTTDNASFVAIQPNMTSCFRVVWKRILVNNGHLLAIYDKSVVLALYEVDVIVGEYMAAVAGFADSLHKMYIVTTPVDEHKRVTQRHLNDRESYMAHVWPTSQTYIDGIHIYAHRFITKEGTKDRIVILHHTETIQGLEYVSTMAETLRGHRTTRPVDVIEIDKHLVNLIEMRANNSYQLLSLDRERIFVGLLSELSRRVKQSVTHHAKLIILYMDGPVDQKKAIFKTLFSKTADLETEHVPWIVADMLAPYRSEEMHFLQEVEIVKTSVHIYVQTRKGDCLLASSVAERGTMWAYDIIVDRLSQIERFDDFTHDNFRKKILSETDNIYGVSLNENGERIKNIMFLMKILPHDFDEAPSCGASTTGVFSYNDPLVIIEHDDIIVQRDNQAYKQAGDIMFYGIRPPDEKRHHAVLVMDKPFVMGKADEGYEGIAIDIFEKTAQILLKQGVQLELDFREVQSYGMKQNGSWSGALGSLTETDEKAVIGLGQFSRTPERESDFRFTSTFGYIQTTFIVKKREGYFYMQFARPFTHGVWYCIMLVMIVSAVYVCLLDAWNPFKDEVSEEIRFNEKESVWFSFLTMFQVGAPFGAYMFPTRVFTVFYWFFAMVVVACYTGNLASFLSDEELIRPDITIDKLLHSDFRFGMLNQSSIASDFKNHHRISYNRIYEKVKERDDFVASYYDGMIRVNEEKFVLIGTSGVLGYYKSEDKDCALVIDNSPAYTKPTTEIAFPMRKDWKLAYEFDEALQELRESGELQSIYRRWMKEDMICEKDDEDEETTRLSFKNFLGLYIILIVMSMMSFVFLGFKLLHLWLRDTYNKRGDAKTPEETEMLNKRENGSRPSGSFPEDAQLEI